MSAASSSKKGKSGDLGVVIKLTDFGIAKILDAQGVTSTGQVLGSPAHMAPEQIEGGDVDARTDVFALGVLMYECLVGHLPFEGKNPAQVLRRVLDGLYAPADRERSTVGGRWSKILAGALARDAAARTPTPAALGEQIRAELEDLAVGDPREAINDYFADPTGYSEELTKRLVPRLVARGEAARKRGDVEGAAADFNRALALAPTDSTILKRVTSLTSSESRRLLLRRAGTVLAGTAVMALLSFGVVRWARARRDALPPASSADGIHPDPQGSSQPAAPLDSSALLAPKPSGASADPGKVPRIHLNLTPPVGSTVVAATPGSAARMVKLVVIPKAATVSEGGNTVDAATGVPHTMSVGVHTFAASVIGSKCCKPQSFSQQVSAPAADKPDEVQTIRIKLDMNPTSVSLVGAPSGAALSCPGIGLSVSAGSSGASVTLTETEWSGTCKFAKADGSSQPGHVLLKAGEAATVPWAGD